MNNIEKFLRENKEKSIEIMQKGFVENKYTIEELNYTIKNQDIKITGEKNNTLLRVNINQAYKIDTKDNQIILYLDNDLIVKIQKKTSSEK